MEEAHDCHGGDCPKCGRCDGYVNVRKAHFGLCKQHRVCWIIGCNLFSSWQYETEADWERNAALLDGFREVQAVHNARSLDEPVH